MKKKTLCSTSVEKLLKSLMKFLLSDNIDNISEEDRVVHLLASLPDSFGVLVTALESNAEDISNGSCYQEAVA